MDKVFEEWEMSKSWHPKISFPFFKSWFLFTGNQYGMRQVRSKRVYFTKKGAPTSFPLKMLPYICKKVLEQVHCADARKHSVSFPFFCCSKLFFIFPETKPPLLELIKNSSNFFLLYKVMQTIYKCIFLKKSCPEDKSHKCCGPRKRERENSIKYIICCHFILPQSKLKINFASIKRAFNAKVL